MSDEINSPLLSLIREQGMVDDLQYEDIVAEFKRNGTPVIQILQDMGIMKLDDILQIEAHALGTIVVELDNVKISPDLLKVVPVKLAQMYKCLPVGMNNGAVQIAMSEPLNPGQADEIQFAVKGDVQL